MWSRCLGEECLCVCEDVMGGLCVCVCMRVCVLCALHVFLLLCDRQFLLALCQVHPSCQAQSRYSPLRPSAWCSPTSSSWRAVLSAPSRVPLLVLSSSSWRTVLCSPSRVPFLVLSSSPWRGDLCSPMQFQVLSPQGLHELPHATCADAAPCPCSGL